MPAVTLLSHLFRYLYRTLFLLPPHTMLRITHEDHYYCCCFFLSVLPRLPYPCTIVLHVRTLLLFP
jgi:hypothetical protein